MGDVEAKEPIRLISFEGPDGSGKSTQIRKVEKWLKELGVNTLLTYEPGDTDFGQVMRDLLLHGNYRLDRYTELFLYLADRREHILKIIKPALLQGYFVLCDRYIDSTVAYQGFGEGIDINLIFELHNHILEGIYPSLTFFLNLPPSIGLQRLTSFDNVENSKSSYHERVKVGYEYLAKKFSERVIPITMNESTSIDDIFQIITSKIIERWPYTFRPLTGIQHKAQ